MVDRRTTGERRWPDSAFWRFSLDLYAQEGVEAACLALQERRGADVNLLLFAIWLASRGITLDAAKAGEIEEVIAGFRVNVVQPLRSARRHLRKMQRASGTSAIASRWPDQVERLRKSAAALELDGEHLIQLALEQVSVGLRVNSSRGAVLVAANLRNVAAFEEADRGDLATLFLRTFDDMTESELTETFRQAGLLEAG